METHISVGSTKPNKQNVHAPQYVKRLKEKSLSLNICFNLNVQRTERCKRAAELCYTHFNVAGKGKLQITLIQIWGKQEKNKVMHRGLNAHVLYGDLLKV